MILGAKKSIKKSVDGATQSLINSASIIGKVAAAVDPLDNMPCLVCGRSRAGLERCICTSCAICHSRNEIICHCYSCGLSTCQNPPCIFFSYKPHQNPTKACGKCLFPLNFSSTPLTLEKINNLIASEYNTNQMHHYLLRKGHFHNSKFISNCIEKGRLNLSRIYNQSDEIPLMPHVTTILEIIWFVCSVAYQKQPFLRGAVLFEDPGYKFYSFLRSYNKTYARRWKSGKSGFGSSHLVDFIDYYGQVNINCNVLDFDQYGIDFKGNKHILPSYEGHLVFGKVPPKNEGQDSYLFLKLETYGTKQGTDLVSHNINFASGVLGLKQCDEDDRREDTRKDMCKEFSIIVDQLSPDRYYHLQPESYPEGAKKRANTFGYSYQVKVVKSLLQERPDISGYQHFLDTFCHKRYQSLGTVKLDHEDVRIGEEMILSFQETFPDLTVHPQQLVPLPTLQNPAYQLQQSKSQHQLPQIHQPPTPYPYDLPPHPQPVTHLQPVALPQRQISPAHLVQHNLIHDAAIKQQYPQFPQPLHLSSSLSSSNDCVHPPKPDQYIVSQPPTITPFSLSHTPSTSGIIQSTMQQPPPLQQQHHQQHQPLPYTLPPQHQQPLPLPQQHQPLSLQQQPFQPLPHHQRELDLQLQRERELQQAQLLQREQRERELREREREQREIEMILQQREREQREREQREREQREREQREREVFLQQQREQREQRERELAHQQQREIRERALREQRELELQQQQQHYNQQTPNHGMPPQVHIQAPNYSMPPQTQSQPYSSMSQISYAQPLQATPSYLSSPQKSVSTSHLPPPTSQGNYQQSHTLPSYQQSHSHLPPQPQPPPQSSYIQPPQQQQNQPYQQALPPQTSYPPVQNAYQNNSSQQNSVQPYQSNASQHSANLQQPLTSHQPTYHPPQQQSQSYPQPAHPHSQHSTQYLQPPQSSSYHQPSVPQQQSNFQNTPYQPPSQLKPPSSPKKEKLEFIFLEPSHIYPSYQPSPSPTTTASPFPFSQPSAGYPQSNFNAQPSPYQQQQQPQQPQQQQRFPY